jgi:hypothetical protein
MSDYDVGDSPSGTPDHLLPFWNRWLLGRDSVGMLNPIRQEFSVRPRDFVCYAYADPEVGLSAHVHLICKVRFTGRIDPVFDVWAKKLAVKFRADMFDVFDLRLLEPAEVSALKLPSEPEWLSFYTNEELEKVRRLEFLHPLRAGNFPDDIRTIVGGAKNKEPEVVWVRTKRLMPDGTLEGVLLNQPYQKLGVNRGDLVRVRVREVPGGIQSYCLGPAKSWKRTLSGIFSKSS